MNAQYNFNSYNPHFIRFYSVHYKDNFIIFFSLASTCQLKFQPITISDEVTSNPFSIVTGDFNSDGQLDLAGLFEGHGTEINVFLGNGNGTFRPQIRLPERRFYHWLAVDDVNNDRQTDLVFCASSPGIVGVWLGNRNGIFENPIMLSTSFYTPTKIVVTKFNNDSYLDIAVTYSVSLYISIYLGNGDGSFVEQTTFPIDAGLSALSLVAGDFNDDGYQDIVMSNSLKHYVVTFLGYGNGTFIEQKKSFTGPNIPPNSIAVGDFDDDTRLDIVFSCHIRNAIGMMFGYGNGSWSARKSYIIRINSAFDSLVAVNDFNHDGHLDVVIGGTNPYLISALLGYGNGTFDEQTIFSGKSWNFNEHLNRLHFVVGDFNNDGHQDIVSANYYVHTIVILLNTCECCASETLKTNTTIH